MADVIVVGGGISGMLSAWYLVQAGKKVQILERGEPGRESSWAGGGIVSPLYPWRYPEPVNRLAKWSQQQFPSLTQLLHEASGIDPEYLTSGLLMPGVGAEEYQQAQAWAQDYPANLQSLDDQQVLITQPELRPPPGYHLWLPEVAQVRNPRILQSLHGALLAYGVEILSHHPVSGLDVREGRVHGVVVGGRHHDAEQVLLCAGAWTDEIHGHQATGIYPVRGQMLLYQAEPGQLEHIILAEDTYLIPRKDGKILAGSTMEYVGYDKTTTIAAREDLEARATSLFPPLRYCEVIQHWAGLRPACEDGIPTISAHPGIAGLFINAGQFRNGVVTGPASAKLVSDLVLGKEPELDPLAYALK